MSNLSCVFRTFNTSVVYGGRNTQLGRAQRSQIADMTATAACAAACALLCAAARGQAEHFQGQIQARPVSDQAPFVLFPQSPPLIDSAILSRWPLLARSLPASHSGQPSLLATTSWRCFPGPAHHSLGHRNLRSPARSLASCFRVSRTDAGTLATRSCLDEKATGDKVAPFRCPWPDINDAIEADTPLPCNFNRPLVDDPIVPGAGKSQAVCLGSRRRPSIIAPRHSGIIIHQFLMLNIPVFMHSGVLPRRAATSRFPTPAGFPRT
jgi:hypothetical protein